MCAGPGTSAQSPPGSSTSRHLHLQHWHAGGGGGYDRNSVTLGFLLNTDILRWIKTERVLDLTHHTGMLRWLSVMRLLLLLPE